MVIVITTNTLERKTYFPCEQRTELYKLYKRYREGVAQLENRFGAKNGLRSQALLGLKRRGA